MIELSTIQNSSATESSTLFAGLENGLLILTPNHRTNVQLLEAYGVYRKQNSLPAVCPSPKIYPIDIWLRTCSEELINNNTAKLSPQILLHPFQELFLWKSIIRESDIGAGLLNLEGTASSVIEAYRIIQQWEISLNEIEAYATGIFAGSSPYEDVDIFLHWLKAYEVKAKEENILSLAQLLINLIDAINQNLIALPTELVLLGFDNPPPLYQRLFQTLSQTSCEVHYQHLKEHSPVLEKKILNNQQQEMLAAALWSKALLDQNSTARIGIICPDLHARKNEVQRVFYNTFYPEETNSSEKIQDTLFSTTASNKLDSIPLIQIMLMLLKLNRETLATLEICHILRSPFLIGGEEVGRRAALEEKLRKSSELNTTLSHLRYLVSQADKPWFCPLLSKAMQAMENLRRQHKVKKTLYEWTGFIEQQLSFMLDPNLQTQEQQQRWHELLKDFSQLAYLTGPVNFSSALDLLNQLARNSNASTFFNQASVQILTPVEASGLQFTHSWFMGLSETNWPAPARGNPFIPRKLQLKFKIPAASADLQYHTASALLQGFYKASSSSLVFSYPMQIDDISIKPSMLLAGFPGEAKHQTLEALHEGLHPLSQHLFGLMNKGNDSSNTVEVFEDSISIPLEDNEIPAGGTALIADQAACPFRSFAKHRLKATELPKLAYGLPAYAVGNMLHHSMEVFWQELKDQNSIDDMDSASRDKLIYKAATAGVKHISKHYPETMNVRYCEMEVKRLCELLTQWLDEERKRGFFTIVEHEYSLQWQYSSLNLKFRIDRIEQFEDKSFGLVDYKTSKNNNTVNWLDARQDKPQLPLYLLAAESDPRLEKVSSLLYAQINIEEMKYRGISENPDTYPGVAIEKQRNLPKSITWEELREFWQDSLQALAQEFLDGFVSIEPKSTTSCQYCHLGSLCRIQEQRQES